jgi:hypothetical protein
MATQTSEVTQRLAPFQEEYLQNLFASTQNLFKPVSDGGQGLTMPYAPGQQAALDPLQQQAMAAAQAQAGGVGTYLPYMQQAAQYAAPSGVSNFFNPYEQAVVDQTMADIGRAGQQQQQQLGASAVGAGAFGGSRQGIAASEIARSTMEQQARSAGQLRQQGYSQAQQAAQQAAQLQAGLGAQVQQMGVQDINTLLGAGGLGQQQQQNLYNTAQQNLLAQQGLPFQQLGYLSDIFQGVPALQQTSSTTTTPPPSTSSQLLGLGIAGLGAYGQAQQGRGFFPSTGN